MDKLLSPLKRSPNKGGGHARKESGQYYFVPREPGVTSEVRDKGDENAVIEVHTDHAMDETYEPKPVNRSLSLMSQGGGGGGRQHSGRLSASARADSIMGSSGRAPPPSDGKPNPLSRTLFAIFGGNKMPPKSFDESGAKKVDPKIFFSLERTFLAWMKASIWVGAISLAIGARSSKGNPEALYSLFFQAIAIAFIIYALVTYAKRSLMVVRRSPGPYEDKWGPVVLGTLFVFSLAAQYCVFVGSYLYTK